MPKPSALNDHNLADEAARRAEIDAADREYKIAWGPLCKQLGITVNMLRVMNPNILISVMLIRMNALYVTRIMDLETRISALEPHGPMMSTRRQSDA